MNREKLELLIVMLKEVEESLSDEVRFDLEVFHDLEDDIDLKTLHWKKPPCGFSACALGFAAMDARFEGLSLQRTSFGRLEVSCKSNIGFNAGSRFFDLSWEEVHYLFDPYEYLAKGFMYDEEIDSVDYSISVVQKEDPILPSHVITRIEWLLARGEMQL